MPLNENPAGPVLLFSYGTLQYPSVQLASFGRELTGRADELPGYTRGRIPIDDPEVIAETGETHYFNAEPSPNPRDSIAGTVYELSTAELASADEYEEPAGYRRILVTLRSGTKAWIYLCAPPPSSSTPNS